MMELLLKLPAGSAVLDLGAAAGSFPLPGAGLLVVRLDRSIPASRRGGAYVAADAARAPFPAASFDFVVANPPFSTKAWTTGFDPEHDLYSRFEDGIPPQKNGDFAFMLHVLKSMKSTGKGAIIMPHGVLFRGGEEKEARKHFIERGWLEAVIGLPAGLFYGTGIPACILVLDKENAAGRTLAPGASAGECRCLL